VNKPTKPIYRFSKEYADALAGEHEIGPDKKWLGGKGASLVTMCEAGLPVPPGFTIHTGLCNEQRAFREAYLKAKDTDLPALDKQIDVWRNNLKAAVSVAMEELNLKIGFPPLVSVRSGAPVSMPGMMDTILNVGINDKNLHQWVERIGERPALDSYRRLIQMLGHTAYGIDDAVFEIQLKEARSTQKVETDAELSVESLKWLIDQYKKVFQAATQKEFPQKVGEQLWAAIMAVFESWMNPRAIEYRKINNISEDMGTAVTVQAMVFGNMGETSGSGVLFTRNPSTGEPVIMAEYLANAQGEDVVAGIRTPIQLELNYLSESSEDWCHELHKLCGKLEAHYRDMVDVEFTVQEGVLYILQSRVGKRSAAAAFKIATDVVAEGLVPTIDTALKRLTVEQYKLMRRPIVDPAYKKAPDHKGLPACPGVAVGIPVFSSQDAVNCTAPCILVTHETTPDDIAGMHKAAGILTQTGGATSHAAVVARAMDKPCIVGCTALPLKDLKAWAKSNPGATITLDGGDGRVWIGQEVPVIDNTASPSIKIVQDWAMKVTGFAEQMTVDPEEVTGPCRIMASHWWGDLDVADVVLMGLANLSKEDRSMITLDLQSPDDMVPEDDHLLEFAFKAQAKSLGPNINIGGKKEHFKDKVCEMLVNNGHLAGLTIANFQGTDAQIDKLRKAGLVVIGAPKTVADVLDGSAAEVSSDFITNVIGGQQAWNKLLNMMEAAGVKMKVVVQAVPAEYATFKALVG
jgi:pyruvate,orthophosphate dikinase